MPLSLPHSEGFFRLPKWNIYLKYAYLGSHEEINQTTDFKI